MQKREIVIVGGGPVGLFMALLLLKQGRNVTLFDAATNIPDGRILALSYATATLFDEYGVWPTEAATAIDHVHISHSGFGLNNIDKSDVNLSHLGFTVKYADICNSLKAQIVKYANCEMIATKISLPAINNAATSKDNNNLNTTAAWQPCLIRDDTGEVIDAELIIVAEGGNLPLHGIDYTDYAYEQTAVIAQINILRPHHNIAYERFIQSGSFVLLPYAQQYMLVWSQENECAPKNVTELAAKLTNMSFMERFGRFTLGDNMSSYPLKFKKAETRMVDNIVLIGNAAQTVHPVSAQGLNLSVRDVFMLSDMIVQHGLDLQRLAQYDAVRKNDAMFVTGFTHGLARLLEQDNIAIRTALSIGLIGLSNCKVIQNQIVKSLIFGV